MGLLDFLRITTGQCSHPSGKHTSSVNGIHHVREDRSEEKKRENPLQDFCRQYEARKQQRIFTGSSETEKRHLPNKNFAKKREPNSISKKADIKGRDLSYGTTIGREPSRNSRSSFACRKSPLSLKFLVFLLTMGSLPGIDPSELSKTICRYLEYKDQCERVLEESKHLLHPNKTYCAGEFDNYMCWPHAEAASVVNAPCPDFYRDLNNSSRFGYRYCRDNGSLHQAWDNESQTYKDWKHIENCAPFETDANSTDLEQGEDESTLLSNLRIMYSIGYGVSLFCLVIALLLLGFFKKLHCTRNYIHMNLMVSFIIRYVVILVKDSVLTSHYRIDDLMDMASNPNYDQLRQYCDQNNSTGWVLTRCRLVITLMHYVITANFFWLLAEGLYLQMLLVFVLSENKHFAGFMVFGWGAPWISVLIWVVLRMQFENSGCWNMNDEMHIWWTIRAPIIISIVINFLIFVNIVRLIVSKLQAHNMARTDVKLRLAKSTLALIPLLGIHYIVFLALTEEVTDTNATPMHLRLAFEMFLGSIQGTLVSILYCFLNNEVRTEVRRAWNVWRSRKNLPKGGSNYRKCSTTVSGNHSTQVTQLYSRHSTAGDMILQDTGNQSQLSGGLEPDNTSIANSSATPNSLGNSDNKTFKNEMSNKNGIVIDAKNKQIYYDRLNGNNNTEDNNRVQATVIVMSVPNGNETNGNVECQDDEPFLREDVV